jgi:nucleoside-diphosphate-sugar epimerase
MGQPLRVLITGGSGFVGANLARAEIRAGNAVHLLLRNEAQLWRLAEIAGQYVPQRGDLRDADAVRRAVAEARPDVIYHLATNGAYPSQNERGVILATNLTGTINLLEALAGRDYQALVNTGSSSEYGHKDAPMRPGDLLEPRTDYGVTKAAATLLCQAEAYKGAPVCTVRIFSAYGPWEEPTRLVPYVLDSCLKRVQARVSVASQPRDFVYVDDVVDLLRVAARQPQCHGKILHAGTGVQSTVGDMVAAIHEVCGGPAPQFGAIEPRPDQPRHWVAGIAETTALTDWTPRCDLRPGVERMKQWWFACQERDHRAAA